MKRKPKVVIVGAGPAGAACALGLAKAGSAEVELLDKSKYPRVKVCGSGLSPHGLKLLERLGLKDRFADNHATMAGLIARGPDGGEIHLRGGKGAWVVPRVELDFAIASEAARHGARFTEDCKVTEVLRDGSGRARGVKTTKGEVEADLVVCANGSPSRFSADESPRYGIRTIMGWWKGVVLEQPDVGVMIWDRRLDGYYAWAFPEPGGVTNIGLTIPEGARQASRLKDLFSDLLADHFSVEMENAEQVGKWMGHPATLTTKVGEIAEAHALWIGEAARLVSPATVEGIAFAMESGTIAADLIGRYFPSDGRGFKPWHLGMYRAKIGAAMLPKFWAAEGFARLMRSDRALDWTTRLLNPQWLAARAASVAGGAGIRPSDSVARA